MPLPTVYFRFAARGADEPARSRVIEKTLAHARGAARVHDWRADALRCIAPEAGLPPLGPALLHWACRQSADAGQAPAAVTAAAAGAWICIASPVHFNAGMSSVVMPETGSLTLDAHEAGMLVADFNRVFADSDARLAATRASVLLCSFDRFMDVAAHDPDAVAGHDPFDFQPTGPDAPRLRRLMSEMEMWLFEHEVNRRRAAHAQPTLTGLWLWGGGPVAGSAPVVRGWTAGRDVFFSFGRELEFPERAGDGVIVCAEQPGTAEWREVERRWLAPAIAALRTGGIGRLLLSAGGRRLDVGAGRHWRFWRRPRPWWEYFETGVEPHAVQ